MFFYYYRYSALGPVWAETRAKSGDWYVSGTLHAGQILRGSLPLLSIDGLNYYIIVNTTEWLLSKNMISYTEAVKDIRLPLLLNCQ